MTKPHLALVAPTTIIGTVRPPRRRRNAEVRAREYLTDAEIARLIAAAVHGAGRVSARPAVGRVGDAVGRAASGGRAGILKAISSLVWRRGIG